jgi:hypothetical protein
MKALKKIAVSSVAALALLSLSGCMTDVGEDGTNSAISTYTVSFPDNSTVYCLRAVSSKTGIKCLWNQPVTTPEPFGLLGSIENVGGVNVRCVTDHAGSMDCDDTAK